MLQCRLTPREPGFSFDPSKRCRPDDPAADSRSGSTMLVKSPQSPLARADAEVRAALAMAEDPAADPADQAEMLMEIARGLLLRPRSPQQLHDAVALCRRALD